MNLENYEAFRIEWLVEVLENNPTTVEKGRRFSQKIIQQWLDFNPESEELIYCDGSGDGGIDLAYFQPKDSTEDSTEDNTNEGDTWYLVQSKYGSAFQKDAVFFVY